MPRRNMFGGAPTASDVSTFANRLISNFNTTTTPISRERNQFEEWFKERAGQMLKDESPKDVAEFWNNFYDTSNIVGLENEVRKFLNETENIGGMSRTTPLSLCMTKSGCLEFGRDDILRELNNRKIRHKLNDNKKQLAETLVNANKGALKQYKAQKRANQKTKTTRGSLPSETTNPHMYDQTTGLLKEKHLTQDHHGLTAFDYAKDKYKVVWNPVTHTAKWEKISGLIYHKDVQFLTGYFTTLKNGLPDPKELDYNLHAGKVFKDKNDKLMQVVCVTTGKDKNYFGKDNCKKDKRFKGGIALTWKPYSKEHYGFGDAAGKISERKFVTPFGVKTYDQLLKMSVDDMIKMLLIIEAMDDTKLTASTQRLMDLGVGPYAPDGALGAMTNMTEGAGLKVGKRKKHSFLSEEERKRQEQIYKRAGLNDCGVWPNAPIMCDDTSAIPGECVTEETECYDKNYIPEYQLQWQSAAAAHPQFAKLYNKTNNYNEFVTREDIRRALEVPSTLVNRQATGSPLEDLNTPPFPVGVRPNAPKK